MGSANLLIDVDNVLADSTEAYITTVNRMGYNISKEDFYDYDFGSVKDKTGWTLKECLGVFQNMWTEDYKSIPLQDHNTVGIVNDMLDRYDAEIVTANFNGRVKSWLDHTGINAEYFKVNDKKEELGHKVLIDDNPRLKLNGEFWLLRDQPWNKETKGAIRIYRLDQAYSIVEMLAREGVVQYRKQ